MLGADTYDVIVLGTGLAESIAAAALANAGHSVLHLDPNEYYGGEQASLTLDELITWSELRGPGPSAQPEPTPGPSSSSDYTVSQARRYTNASTSGLGALADDRRRYALTLFPALLVSRGQLIETLIDSDVSKYVGFRLLDGVSVQEGGEARRVPGAKEDVFKDRSISLMDKRRLMKALMFAGGEFEEDETFKGHESDPIYTFLKATFSLPPQLATALTYAVAHASSPDEPALAALQRARRYLRSIGRYGPSAFLVGQYGGAGEVAQGFCRASAVFGGTYILGPDAAPSNITVGDHSVTLNIPAHPTPLTAGHLIASPDFVPASLRPTVTQETTTSHAVVVLTQRPTLLTRPRPVGDTAGLAVEEGTEPEPQTEAETEADDTAVLVLPPTDGAPLIKALVQGEGTGSCPANQWIVYLWTAGDDVDALKTQVGKWDGVAFEAYYVRKAESWEEKRLQPPPQAQAEDATAAAEAIKGHAAPPETERKESPPLVVLRPYAGAHMLTEGLDWEARQGEAAFRAVSDRTWFERSAEDGEEEME